MTKLADLDAETRQLVIELAVKSARQEAQRHGVDPTPFDVIGEPDCEDLDADPIVFVWPDGTRFSIPSATLALVTAAARTLERERRQTLN